MLYIGCSRSNQKIKVMSNLIIWFQKIKFRIMGIEAMDISHIYGRFVGSSWNRDFIYHQHGSGSSFIGGKLFSKKHQTVKELRLRISRSAEIKIGQVCVDREGVLYSFSQNVGIAIVGIVWMLTSKRIKNPFTQSTNCIEEWVVILCDELRMDMPKHVDSWLPQDFWMWLETLPCVDPMRSELLSKDANEDESSAV